MDRPRLAATFGALQVTVEQLPPRAGMRAALAAARVFGPTLVELLTSGPITIGQYRVTLPDILSLYAGRAVTGKVLEGEDWKAATLSIKSHPELAGTYVFLARRVNDALASLSPDEILQLSDSMVIDQTRLSRADGSELLVKSTEMLDAMVPSAVVLFGILRLALEVNLRPFVDEIATFVGS